LLRAGILGTGDQSNVRRRFAAECMLVLAMAAVLPARRPVAAAAEFVRGDTDATGVRNITDAIRTLGFLFLGSPDRLDCLDAADVDDDGRLSITDPIALLLFLFSGGRSPPEPFSACGADPTFDGLDCQQFAQCTQPSDALPPPELEPISSPTSLRVVSLHGQTLPDSNVRVDGGATPATGAADATGSFAIDVELFADRLNRLFAVASDREGRTSPASVLEVIQDGQPPELFVDEPLDGAVLYEATTVVAGRVADTLSGFRGFAVAVNGEPADVIIGIGTNGTFERGNVPLALGSNSIVVEAMDVVGNRSTKTVTVRRESLPTDQPRIRALSGNGQKGVVHQLLSAPIVVEVLKADGSPFAGKLVEFEVTRSDGRLGGGGGGESTVLYQTRADNAGRARAFWILGSDAGCGNQRVVATSAGVVGAARFCASAAAGPPTQINVGSGNNQRGESGVEAPEKLRAWVNDGCNGVADVMVTFRVVAGGGKVDGKVETVVPTSSTGHADVRLTLGRGLQQVEATFEGNGAGPALFTAFGVERTGTDTRFTGVVLDNAGQPLGGAVCLLEFPDLEPLQTATTTDGQFLFAEIPRAGLAFLRVDGSSATRLAGANVPAGSFPLLSYDILLVEGAENSLPTPVILPRLDPRNARTYNGTTDVVLEVAGVEGLSMRVRAGSVTLTGGRRPSPAEPATLGLHAVHFDDIPMPLPDGAAPPFAWTLQPAGTKFSPPVEITAPNMAGLPAGAVSYFLSFNHDTGRFEIVASGRVSSDGAWIRSDPGAGIRTAGWGGSCPPYPVAGDTDYCEGSPSGEGAGGASDECCPKAPRFVRTGPGRPNTYLDRLQISNFVTTQSLDEPNGHKDVDNFKLEVVDGDVDEDEDEVTTRIESLRPGGGSFAPRREIDITLKRVGDTSRFRSGWLRLVSDEVDDGSTTGGAAAVAAQTLLVSTDDADPGLEIIGQIVRASYSSCSKDLPVGGPDSPSLDVHVHVLSDVPPSKVDNGVQSNLSTNTAIRVVEKQVRRIFAQANIRLGQIQADPVLPVENLIAVSDADGAAATGNSFVSIEVTSVRSPTETVHWTQVHFLTAGATPVQTAQAIADALKFLNPDAPAPGGDFLSVEAFENSVVSATVLKNSADVLIRDPHGGEVKLIVLTNDFTQKFDVARADKNLKTAPGTNGSKAERALARNYASSTPRIDIFVVEDLFREDGTNTGINGKSQILRGQDSAAVRTREPLLGCVFAKRSTGDDTNRTKVTFAHEIGHILLDAGHATNDDTSDGLPAQGNCTQVMGAGGGEGPCPDSDQVDGRKRFQDGNYRFEHVGGKTNSGPINQVQRLHISPFLHP
jgi:hypothetical protein